MKNSLIQVTACGLLIISTSTITKDPQTINNNNIHIYTSATQASSSTNMLSAVQQIPISSAMLEKLAKNSESFVSKNKLILSTIAGAYLYGRTFVAVVRANHALAESTSWASWKSELSVDELKALDQATLTKELLHEIQKRHTNAEKPADALLPFITFLGRVDDEITQINHYRSLHFWVETCHVAWMFPFNEQRFASASARLERLWFLKNLFLSWAADYKLSNYIKSPASLVNQVYRYLTEKFGALWPETDIKAADSTSYLADYQQRARRRTLLTGIAEAVCLVPALVAINAVLPAQQRSYTNNNTVSVYL